MPLDGTVQHTTLHNFTEATYYAMDTFHAGRELPAAAGEARLLIRLFGLPLGCRLCWCSRVNTQHFNILLSSILRAFSSDEVYRVLFYGLHQIFGRERTVDH